MVRLSFLSGFVLIQPRQSNTGGALSLDHVYEFILRNTIGGFKTIPTNLTLRSEVGGIQQRKVKHFLDTFQIFRRGFYGKDEEEVIKKAL